MTPTATESTVRHALGIACYATGWSFEEETQQRGRVRPRVAPRPAPPIAKWPPTNVTGRVDQVVIVPAVA